MSTAKPTLIFIHGAWHEPNHASKLRDQLQEYEWIAPALPCVGCEPGSPITKSWQPDIDTIRNVITSTLSASPNGKILLITHSYGGMATSEALGYVAAADRHRIRHITIASPIVDVGSNLSPDLGRPPPPMWHIENGICTPVEPEKYMYHDLPLAEAKKWSAQLRHVPTVLMTQNLTYAAEYDFKTTYVVCTEDRSLPPEAQEMMATAAQAKGAKVDVLRLPSSHSPYLSMPEKVAEIVRGVAEDEEW